MSKPRSKPGPKGRSQAAAEPAAEPAADESAREGRMLPVASGVKVRMYRTGLGDCFLLCFPRRKARDDTRDAFYMLIDFGASRHSRNAAERMKKIAESIRRATAAPGDSDGAAATPGDQGPRGRIDILVLTHEHWDHLSGFDEKQARGIFEKHIDIERVWMAWTEDPGDRDARRLQDGLAAQRVALAKALVKAQAMKANRPESAAIVERVLSFFGLGPDDLHASAAGGLGARADHAIKISQGTRTIRDWVRDESWKRRGSTGASREPRVDFHRPCDEGKAIEMRDVGFRHADHPDEPSADAGARVYVLGPPEDPVLIKYDDPKGEDERAGRVYELLAHDKEKLALAGLMETAFFSALGTVTGYLDDPESEDAKEISQICIPFDRTYRIERKDVEMAAKRLARLRAARRDESEAASGDRARTRRDTRRATADSTRDRRRWCARKYYARQDNWRRIDGDWLEPADGLALQLDGATNNSSLALAIEIGRPGEGKVLLFPGDAQIGSWRSWFGKVPRRNGEPLGKEMVWTVGTREVRVRDLLARTVLYKVGHHGSHNATLRHDGLEIMGTRWPDEFVAMLPVDEEVAKNREDYGQMPRTSLVVDLLNHTDGKLMRIDEDAHEPEKEIKVPPYTLEERSAEFEGVKHRENVFSGKVKTDLYIQYTVYL